MIRFFIITAVLIILISFSPLSSFSSNSSGTGNNLVSNAKAFLCQNLSIDTSKNELKELYQLNDPCLSDSTVQIKFTSYGQYWVGVEAYKDGRVLRTFLLKFKLLSFADVYYAKINIKAGDSIKPEFLGKERRGIETGSGGGGAVISNIEDIKGKRARCFIKEGTLLSFDKLEGIPDIKRFDDIRIKVIKEDLIISSVGKAQEDGHKGSDIKVRMASGKLIKGFVNENGEVEVNL